MKHYTFTITVSIKAPSEEDARIKVRRVLRSGYVGVIAVV